jgi:HTH-type transcriptional regulator, sugar sensing transcriptional regulator
MTSSKHFVTKLKEFGLNSYEGKLWAALLSRGVSTAGELSDLANVPRSRSYDVLESLEKKGFIVMKLGKPIKYLAVPPSEVLERVKKNVKQEAETQAQVLDTLKNSEILNELTTLHKQGSNAIEPTSLSGVLKGRHSYYNHLDLLIKKAKNTVLLATTTEGLIRKAEHLKTSFAKAKSRGVKVKIIAPITRQSKPALDLLKTHAEIKHANVSARFCVVDGKDVVFTLLNDSTSSTYDSAVWINTPFFASTLTTYFEKDWKSLESASKVVK